MCKCNIKFSALIIFAFSLFFCSSASYAVRYYHDGYSRYAPYVCYKSRYKVRHAYYTDLLYRGCHRSSIACRYSNSYHFGRYSSSQAAQSAFKRCARSLPRYVD
jgi:hypothetical protein